MPSGGPKVRRLAVGREMDSKFQFRDAAPLASSVDRSAQMVFSRDADVITQHTGALGIAGPLSGSIHHARASGAIRKFA